VFILVNFPKEKVFILVNFPKEKVLILVNFPKENSWIWSILLRKKDSVAKRHRTKCGTIVTPLKCPEWHVACGSPLPYHSARSAPQKTVASSAGIELSMPA
jgi:hypothetical protein